MTDQKNYTPSAKIGKITGVELNKAAASGKTTNHILNGFILDPITGTEIGIRIVINTEAKRFDPKLKKFVVDDKAPLKGDAYLKGLRKEGSYESRSNTFLTVEEFIAKEHTKLQDKINKLPEFTKIFSLDKEGAATSTMSSTSVKVAKKVIEVDDSENPF